MCVAAGPSREERRNWKQEGEKKSENGKWSEKPSLPATPHTRARIPCRLTQIQTKTQKAALTKENVFQWQNMRSEPSSTSAIASRLLWEELASIDGGGSRLLVEHLQGDFGCVFFGVVDELAIVPVSSGDVLALDCHCARPSGPSTCISDARVISIPPSNSELKVGVQVRFCNAPLCDTDTSRTVRTGKMYVLRPVRQRQCNSKAFSSTWEGCFQKPGRQRCGYRGEV